MQVRHLISYKQSITGIALRIMQVKDYISDKKGVASHASKTFIIMQVKHADESKG